MVSLTKGCGLITDIGRSGVVLYEIISIKAMQDQYHTSMVVTQAIITREQFHISLTLLVRILVLLEANMVWVMLAFIKEEYHSSHATLGRLLELVEATSKEQNLTIWAQVLLVAIRE